MASDSDYAIILQRVGLDGFDETTLRAMIDRLVDLNLVAAEAWTIRAGRYHALVNTSESGSSRSMGDLYKNALAMAAMYRGLYDKENAPAESASGRTRTGKVVRA